MPSAQTMLERFKQVFPVWADDIESYTLQKDDTLKVELNGKRFYIFTYVNDVTWKLESVRMYKKAT